jgi:hypothetical protein
MVRYQGGSYLIYGRENIYYCPELSSDMFLFTRQWISKRVPPLGADSTSLLERALDILRNSYSKRDLIIIL